MIRLALAHRADGSVSGETSIKEKMQRDVLEHIELVGREVLTAVHCL